MKPPDGNVCQWVRANSGSSPRKRLYSKAGFVSALLDGVVLA